MDGGSETKAVCMTEHAGQDRTWILNVLHDQAPLPHSPSSSIQTRLLFYS